MITIMKYFVDFYAEVLTYMESKGFGGEGGLTYDEDFFHAFLLMFLGLLFGGLTIVFGLIGALAPAANGLFVTFAVITGIVMIIFFIFMFVKFVEAFNWG